MITKEIFPDGHIEDYWLGTPYDSTAGQPGWRPVEEVLRAMRHEEIDSWIPDEDAIEALIRHDPNGRGGGLQGGTPELLSVRAMLIANGTRALEWERRLS